MWAGEITWLADPLRKQRRFCRFLPKKCLWMICEDVCVTVVQVNWLDLHRFATVTVKSCSCHTWSLAVKLILKHALWGGTSDSPTSWRSKLWPPTWATKFADWGRPTRCNMCNERKWKKHVSCILCKVYKTIGFISKTKCTKGLKRMKEERWLFQRMNHDKPLGGDRWGHLWHQNIYETLQFGGIATSTAPVWGRESQTISTATSGPWVLILGAGNGCFETPFWG